MNNMNNMNRVLIAIGIIVMMGIYGLMFWAVLSWLGGLINNTSIHSIFSTPVTP